ncbi:MAG: TOBE domain-containing protein, partial [Thiohalocapsa sp.]
GQHVRVRILARDISIAKAPTTGTSILNTLPAKVVSIGDESHPALALVKLQVDGSAVLARVTRRSAEQLGLTADMPVWIQIKAVALL